MNRKLVVLTLVCVALASVALAKDKTPASSFIDKGSFGVFVNGQRVATEHFTIKQTGDSSTTSSEINLGDGKTQQTGELRLASNGDIIRYEWREQQPPKALATVEPNQGFLIERVTGPDGKTNEQPFLLPASSVILDDFFFSHRQLLLWRYLAANCHQKPGEDGCTLAKAQFGVVIPRQRVSAMVSLEFAGREKVLLKGAEQELSKFSLKAEGMDWSLWVNSEHKIMRIAIPESNTEILRD